MKPERDTSSRPETPWAPNGWIQLARYVLGDLEPLERAEAERSMERDPSLSSLMGHLRRFWTRPVPAMTPDVDQGLAAVLQKLRLPARTSIEAGPEQRRMPKGVRTGIGRTTRVMAIASVIVLAIMLVRWIPSKSSTNAATHQYATHTGQWGTVQLIDGSRITLAPHTVASITISSHGDRVVRLSGQAQFDVVAQRGVSFTVHTGSVTTRVLGTAFNVSFYPGDSLVQVAVASGRVTVGNRRPIVIHSGQTAYIGDTLATISEGQTVYSEWRGDRIRFERTTVRDVLSSVGRWYGLEFRLADTSLARRHVSATFHMRSASDAIHTLTLILGVSATVHDTVVTLTPLTDTDGAATPSRRLDPHPFSLPEVGR